MINQYTYQDNNYSYDSQKPIDISIQLDRNEVGPNCFYAPRYEAFPVKTDSFVGCTQQGGLLNFYNIKLNPHGNGTHTECVGHIAKERYLLSDCLTEFHFHALLISVNPAKLDNGDYVINTSILKDKIGQYANKFNAIVIRTLPNEVSKKREIYSGNNPTYFTQDCIEYINEIGVQHLLTDLPSVDREEDGGALISHKTFWGYPKKVLKHKSITELIFVNDNIVDGYYFLNLMVGNFDLDVSPSRPMLYKLK